MTQEEKAKRYDEVIERLKDFRFEYRFSGFGDVIEEKFPELAESEDERTRKAIIKHFEKERKESRKVNYYGVDVFDILAWLEKQGEQKQDPCEHCEDKYLNCHNFPCITKREFEQGKSAIEAIKEEQVDNANKVEQKPAWSGEDERKLELLKALIEDTKGDSASYSTMFLEMEELDNWLKYLKDRVLPQPRQEWSEEDEYYYGIIQYILNNECVGKTDKENAINWLKSLKDRYTWKPSEGQLECLGYAIDKAEKDWSPLTNNRIYLTLKALKEQLKKL